MTFRVGMKVVCVVGSDLLLEKQVYTVLEVVDRDYWKTPGLLLVEVKPNKQCVAFESLRFRPAVDSRKSVSFTAGAPKDSERWDNRVKKPVRA